MPARTFALAFLIAASGAVLPGCAGGRGAPGEPGLAAAGDVENQPPESRAERYARGEYRRGFGKDSEKNAEFCRLHPADTSCIGRRF